MYKCQPRSCRLQKHATAQHTSTHTRTAGQTNTRWCLVVLPQLSCCAVLHREAFVKPSLKSTAAPALLHTTIHPFVVRQQSKEDSPPPTQTQPPSHVQNVTHAFFCHTQQLKGMHNGTPTPSRHDHANTLFPHPPTYDIVHSRAGYCLQSYLLLVQQPWSHAKSAAADQQRNSQGGARMMRQQQPATCIYHRCAADQAELTGPQLLELQGPCCSCTATVQLPAAAACCCCLLLLLQLFVQAAQRLHRCLLRVQWGGCTHAAEPALPPAAGVQHSTAQQSTAQQLCSCLLLFTVQCSWQGLLQTQQARQAHTEAAHQHMHPARCLLIASDCMPALTQLAVHSCISKAPASLLHLCLLEGTHPTHPTCTMPSL
jgi:hypothetical protein